MLCGDVGEIRFLEWKQGSVRVPCCMPGWVAHHLWNLFRTGDEELVRCMFEVPTVAIPSTPSSSYLTAPSVCLPLPDLTFPFPSLPSFAALVVSSLPPHFLLLTD
eukprot:760400-Hanusia_phi.AAC.12